MAVLFAGVVMLIVGGTVSLVVLNVKLPLLDQAAWEALSYASTFQKYVPMLRLAVKLTDWLGVPSSWVLFSNVSVVFQMKRVALMTP